MEKLAQAIINYGKVQLAFNVAVEAVYEETGGSWKETVDLVKTEVDRCTVEGYDAKWRKRVSRAKSYMGLTDAPAKKQAKKTPLEKILALLPKLENDELEALKKAIA